MIELLPLLLSALLAGAAGSIHCLAMCGALCGSLGLACTGHGTQQTIALTQLHLGRIGGYALLGALVSTVGAGILEVAPGAQARAWLQAASGAAMVLLGLRLMLGAQAFAWLEVPGRLLWPSLARWGRPLVPAQRIGQRLALGALWSALPCGLLYSVLLMAGLRGDVIEGAAIMLAFGLGTAPALLGSGHLAKGGLRTRHPALLNVAAIFVCGLGTLSLVAALAPGALGQFHLLIGLDCVP